MKVSLVVLTPGKWQGKTIPIIRFPFHIGRDPDCHLRPASPLVSKHHCTLLVRQGRAWVKDLGSTNGTFVNDQPVTAEQPLQTGDWLRVGPLDFEVTVEAAAPVKRPAAQGTGQPSDEEAAALLLSLHDERPLAAAEPEADLEEIPLGQTATAIPALQPIAWEDLDGVIAIHFTDRKILDEKKIQLIGDQLSSLLEQSGRRKFLLNLGTVRALSSALVDQLLLFDREVRRAGGRLVICQVHPLVAPVFRHTQSAKVLTLKRNTEEGIEALR
jgi:anti-anti-sigma factor